MLSVNAALKNTVVASEKATIQPSVQFGLTMLTETMLTTLSTMNTLARCATTEAKHTSNKLYIVA